MLNRNAEPSSVGNSPTTSGQSGETGVSPGFETDRTSITLAFAIVIAAAFFTRLMPLAFSQYPFNNDSLVECGIVADILQHGRLEYSPGSPWEGTHSVDIPALSVLLAYASAMLGTGPLESAQCITAIFSMTTVGVVFLIGRMFTGTQMGGLIAAMAALLSGTFVFSTGSTWKLALSFSLLALLYLAFLRRNIMQYRILTFVVLGVLPFVHHLAASVALVALAFMLIWSWIVAISRSEVPKRLWWDSATVIPPIFIASAYYSTALIDRQSVFASEIKIVLFICNFILLSIVAYFIMTMKTHQRLSFAPLVAEGIAAVLLIDYLGLVFPYRPSAPAIYVALILSTAALVAIAWYGAEIVIEHRRRFMAVQMSLLVAPLTIIMFGIETGLPNLSHQIVYRTFDFLQFFVFIGLAVGLVDLRMRRPRLYRYAVTAMMAALVCSFPFGFFTQDLLGVRHDSQAYELDAIEWLPDHTDAPSVVSDERLAFMAHSTIWVEKRPYLPQNLMRGYVLLPDFYYIVEDRWTTSGVNNFPYGLAVVDSERLETALYKSNVLYVGGPVDDRIIVFSCNDYTSYT